MSKGVGVFSKGVSRRCGRFFKRRFKKVWAFLKAYLEGVGVSAYSTAEGKFLSRGRVLHVQRTLVPFHTRGLQHKQVDRQERSAALDNFVRRRLGYFTAYHGTYYLLLDETIKIKELNVFIYIILNN